MEKLYQIDSQIVAKKQLAEKHFLITFYSPEIAHSAKPGQFVMIKIDNEKTFLRRPFSICGVNKKTFDIVFKVVGCGTEVLSRCQVGDSLSIIGPLGNCFPSHILHLTSPISLVAGGTGIASLLFLAKHLSTYSLIHISTAVFIGAKTKKEILFKKEFKKLGCKLFISTDDGTLGKKGLISDVFANHLTTYPPNHLSTAVYACGSKPMLKQIAEISKKYKLKCYISLEEKMACGIGACMGCVIKTIKNEKLKMKNNYEYKRVCKDGPIFDAEQIIWE
ncbi:MAG: dihydroorotate dehydrogenase electron transfer subunit [Elusimicrobiota bacterium]